MNCASCSRIVVVAFVVVVVVLALVLVVVLVLVVASAEETRLTTTRLTKTVNTAACRRTLTIPIFCSKAPGMWQPWYPGPSGGTEPSMHSQGKVSYGLVHHRALGPSTSCRIYVVVINSEKTPPGVPASRMIDVMWPWLSRSEMFVLAMCSAGTMHVK